MLIFPDVNAWLALIVRGHQSGERIRSWYDTQNSSQLIFCRITYLGLLRLLTLKAVMGSAVLSNADALQLVSQWIDSGLAELTAEPASLEKEFRKLASRKEVSPKRWTDDYISAFAMESGLTLVTFDQALAKRTSNSILL